MEADNWFEEQDLQSIFGIDLKIIWMIIDEKLMPLNQR